MSYSSGNTMPVHMPVGMMEALGDHVGMFWSDWKLSGVICEAVEAWMKPAPPAAPAPAGDGAEAGCQWKQVFLPEGTRLRAAFKRQPWFAVVEGGEVTCEGRAMSPSAFANLRGSGNRNAWKAVWLRFPGSSDWVRADVCRAARLAGIARMFGPDAADAGHELAAVPRRRPRSKAKGRGKPRTAAAAAPGPGPGRQGTPPSSAATAQVIQGAGLPKPSAPLSRSARRKLRRMKHRPGNP